MPGIISTVAVEAGPRGYFRRCAGLYRGDEDGNSTPRSTATAKSPKCWSKIGDQIDAKDLLVVYGNGE